MDRCRLDLIHTDSGWSWAFFARNAEQISRSSEPVRSFSDLMRSVQLGSPAVFQIQPNGEIPDAALRWDAGSEGWEEVVVRVLDHRTATPQDQPLPGMVSER